MFTWICPQCGREVPPSYPECPNCAERRARQNQPAPATAAPPAPPQPVVPQPAPAFQAPAAPAPPLPAVLAAPPPPPSVAYAPPPPPPESQHSQPYYLVGEQKKGLPPWLVMLGTAAVLGGVLWSAYQFLGRDQTASGEEAPARQAAVPSGSHPYAKYLEVTGIRVTEEKQRLKIQYLVVNHSAADFNGVELNVALTTVNAGPNDPPVASFTSKVGTVPAFGFKEVTEMAATRLRAYEIPDWQFLKATFSITAPQ